MECQGNDRTSHAVGQMWIHYNFDRYIEIPILFITCPTIHRKTVWIDCYDDDIIWISCFWFFLGSPLTRWIYNSRWLQLEREQKALDS